MASNFNTTPNKRTQALNAQGQMERMVDTVDNRSSVGQGQEQKPVQVIHQSHSAKEDSGTGSGVLASATAAVASTLQSAREAVSGK
ncbi:unnamed protein product [Ilex paraguariensis]|uniref:Uncharacterized protein n=1 Tax=Ilex paraguariensis TaxID=185542 RepID=A0ABC8S677_9AQUA